MTASLLKLKKGERIGLPRATCRLIDVKSQYPTSLMKQLVSNYPIFRDILLDGNSLYRAFAFKYLQMLFCKINFVDYDRMKTTLLQQLANQMQLAEFSRQLIPDQFQNIFHQSKLKSIFMRYFTRMEQQVKNIEFSNQDISQIVSTGFYSKEFDFVCIIVFRLLAFEGFKQKCNKFMTVMLGTQDKTILEYGEDGNSVVATFIAQILGIGLVVVESQRQTKHQIQNPNKVTLLFFKGSYLILYDYNHYSEQFLKVLEVTTAEILEGFTERLLIEKFRKGELSHPRVRTKESKRKKNTYFNIENVDVKQQPELNNNLLERSIQKKERIQNRKISALHKQKIIEESFSKQSVPMNLIQVEVDQTPSTSHPEIKQFKNKKIQADFEEKEPIAQIQYKPISSKSPPRRRSPYPSSLLTRVRYEFIYSPPSVPPPPPKNYYRRPQIFEQYNCIPINRYGGISLPTRRYNQINPCVPVTYRPYMEFQIPCCKEMALSRSRSRSPLRYI